MNEYEDTDLLKVDLVYAHIEHPENIFGEDIYVSDAKFWLHENLAKIVIEAAKSARNKNLKMVLKDGLRPTDAQQKMLDTKIVQENLHWLEPPRLLSPPGKGGHPRGMAVDVTLEDETGKELDFGTVFDALPPLGKPNPAARDYKNLPQGVLENRAYLEKIMMDGATKFGMDLLPLPNEWWDFRFPAEIYNQYEPLSDNDFPFHLTKMD